MSRIVVNLALLIIVVLTAEASRLTVQVEPKTMECFGIIPPVGEKVTVKYYVMRGGLLDIDIKVQQTQKVRNCDLSLAVIESTVGRDYKGIKV